MYKQFFGLNDNPFSIAPNPQYLVMTPNHREALAHLLYGVKSSGGFVMLTGEVGTGKTTICRCFLQQVPEDVDVAFVVNPKLSVTELLESICDELGVLCYTDEVSVKTYVDQLNGYLLAAHSRGRKTLLVIDEAQNLSVQVLEQLRLLTNLETDREKLLQIVLIGQPELHEIFERRELRQLAQRVTARFHLTHLGLQETDAYLQHRLAVAGAFQLIFEPAAVKTLFKVSGGIPRLINVICDRALLGAYSINSRTVDKTILKRAAREVIGVPMNSSVSDSVRTGLVAASAVLLVSAIGFFAVQNSAWFDDVTPLANNDNSGVGVASVIAVPGKMPWPLSNDEAQAEIQSDEQSNTAANLITRKSDSLLELPAPAAIASNYSIVEAADYQSLAQESLGNRLELETLGDDSLKAIINKQSPQKPVALNNLSIAAAQVVVPSWAEGLSRTGSFYSSYIGLFQLWDTNYSPSDHGGDPCDHAKQANLECLQKRGDFDSIIALNRPAVLLLQVRDNDAADQRIVYVLLTGVNSAYAELIAGDTRQVIPREALQQLWAGDYTLFWKTPKDYFGSLKEGSVGPAVKWLKYSLAQSEGFPLQIKPNGIFDDNLKKQVMNFQRKAHLEADGIVGTETLISLNESLYENLPHLDLSLNTSEFSRQSQASLQDPHTRISPTSNDASGGQL